MQKIQSDLWETKVEQPVKGLTTRAYLLTRSEGNVLFYNTGHVEEIEAMEVLGGVAYQFLSHEDELGDSLKLIRKKYAAKLGGHLREKSEFERFVSPDLLFDQRRRYLDCIDVIPTPGHTPGSVCFLVQSKTGKSYLFTGDTLYLSKAGIWKAGYLPGYSDRNTLIESLKLLQQLEPDYVMSSGSDGGGGYQAIDPDEWPDLVGRALLKLYKGRQDVE